MRLFEIFGEVALRGADRVQTGLNGLNERAERVGDRMQSMGGRISSAGGTLTKFVTGPLLLAGGGLLALATRLGNTADSTLDLRDSTAMSVESIQQWRHVSRMAGVDQDAMASAAGRLNRQIRNIRMETGPVADAISRLGINIQEFLALDADQRMDMLVKALRDVEDPAQRAALGADIFSREWDKIAPIVGLSADELERFREEGERFAMSEEELNKANEFRMAMEQLKAEFGAAVQTMTIELLPAMIQFAEWIRETGVPMLQTFIGWIADLAAWFGDMPAPVQGTIAAFVGLVAALGPVLMIFGKVIAIIGKLLPWIVRLIGLLRFLHPVSAIVTVAIMAIIYVFQEWDRIVAALVSTYEWLVEKVSQGIELLMEAHERWMEFLKAFWTALKEFVVDIVTAQATFLVDAFTEMWDTITDLAQAAIDALIEMFTGWWTRWVDFSKKSAERIGELTKDLWEWIVEVTDGGTANALDLITAWYGGVLDIFLKLARGVKEVIEDMVGYVVGRVTDMVNGVIGMITSMWQAVVGNSIVPDMADGVIDEIDRMATESENRVKKMTNDLTKSFSRQAKLMADHIVRGRMFDNRMRGIGNNERSDGGGFDRLVQNLRGEGEGGNEGRGRPDNTMDDRGRDDRRSGRRRSHNATSGGGSSHAGAIHIDMRNSTFRDGADMEDRIHRSGVTLSVARGF